ncbi:MAG: hypothetical protein NZ765_11885 [Anaerolineae bacterium]|nr:hypothetical protein [Anaerolineae bacterium]MDW8072318.1 hypothetical protein [Anaerolineae bacterium]
MPNPLACLTPVLELLAENLKILPATGGAVEELQHPEVDEIEDVLINREIGEITDFAETPTPSLRSLYRPTPPLFRKDRHLFRFFVDGSLRTYYLATGVEGRRSFPIQLAQVGAAAMERDAEGRVRCLQCQHRILLLVPTREHGLSDTLWQKLERLRIPGVFEPVDIIKKTSLTPREPAEDDLRNRAGGIARHRMHQLEIDLIAHTDAQRNENSWLILDGAVKLDDFIAAPYLIGVAKSFRKDPQFRFGGHSSARRDITSILAGLEFAHRTAAFSAYDGKVAFWYVRLRPQEELDYPLMGVVKVELPRPDGSPVDAELADTLSRALVAERNVTPYGRDRRWHCHLYPIYLAEQTIKNRFYSSQVLLGAIRWPRLAQWQDEEAIL